MSLTRSEQSKVNGSKSRGAVTSEGKARSAMNHTKHGMYSTRVVLETESKEIFQVLAGLYYDLFQPRDQFEADLLDSLIHARWKIRRLEAAHSAEMNLTIAEHHHEFTEKYGTNIGPDILHAVAYRASGKYLDILDKHLVRQERLFTYAYRNLSKYRGNQPLPSVQDLKDAELEIPSNSPQPAVEPQHQPDQAQPVQQTPQSGERFEPSVPSPILTIAIILLLVLSSITFADTWRLLYT